MGRVLVASISILTSLLAAKSLSAGSSATAGATAVVLAPVAVRPMADLRFGAFSVNASGEVVIAAGGARAATSGVVLSMTDGGQAAAFTVEGTPNVTFSITLPSEVVISHEEDSTHAMTVDALTSSPAESGTLSAEGGQIVHVGGTLSVPQAPKPGRYSGSFAVVIEYD
jgi:hypothetical protein